MSITNDISYVDQFGFTMMIDDFFVDTSVAAGGETASLDLSGLNNLMSLTVLLLGYHAGLAAGTFDFENSVNGNAIVLSGVALPVAAVPLPAGLPLLVGALGLLGWTRCHT